MLFESDTERARRYQETVKLYAGSLPVELIAGANGDSAILAMDLASQHGFDLGEALDVAKTALADYDKTTANGENHGSATDY